MAFDRSFVGVALAALPLGLLAPFVRAQEREAEKITPAFEELFLGEILYPQNRGEIQFTTGFLWNHRGRHDFRAPVLVEYGVTD